MKSQMESRFGPMLGWDDWTQTIAAIVMKVLLLIKSKKLLVPVTVHVSSIEDDPLVDYRVNSMTDAPGSFEIIGGDIEQWTAPGWPLSVLAEDASGVILEWTIDDPLGDPNA